MLTVKLDTNAGEITIWKPLGSESYWSEQVGVVHSTRYHGSIDSLVEYISRLGNDNSKYKLRESILKVLG